MSPQEVGRVSAMALTLAVAIAVGSLPYFVYYCFFVFCCCFFFSVGDCKTIKATPDCHLHSLTMALMATRMRTSLLVGLALPPSSSSTTQPPAAAAAVADLISDYFVCVCFSFYMAKNGQ